MNTAFSNLIALDPENLATEDRRKTVAWDLFQSGVMPHDEAARLCDLLAKEAAGEQLLPALREWCADRRKLIADFETLEAKRAEGWREQSEFEGLKAQRADLVEKLSGHRELLAGAERFIAADHTAGFERFMAQGAPTGSPLEKAFLYGRDLAAARELAAILKRFVLPAAEKDLASVTNQIAAFERKLATAAE